MINALSSCAVTFSYRKGPIGYISTENGCEKVYFGEDFFTNLIQRQKEQLSALTASQDKLPPRVELSDEEIAQLAADYDPRYMSQKEYDQFITELLAKGVLREEDTHFIERHGRVPINPFGCGLTVGSQLPASLSDAGGDLLYFAKAMSLIQADINAPTAYQQSTALKRSAYEAISNVLDRMIRV